MEYRKILNEVEKGRIRWPSFKPESLIGQLSTKSSDMVRWADLAIKI